MQIGEEEEEEEEAMSSADDGDTRRLPKTRLNRHPTLNIRRSPDGRVVNTSEKEINTLID